MNLQGSGLTRPCLLLQGRSLENRPRSQAQQTEEGLAAQTDPYQNSSSRNTPSSSSPTRTPRKPEHSHMCVCWAGGQARMASNGDQMGCGRWGKGEGEKEPGEPRPGSREAPIRLHSAGCGSPWPVAAPPRATHAAALALTSVLRMRVVTRVFG